VVLLGVGAEITVAIGMPSGATRGKGSAAMRKRRAGASRWIELFIGICIALSSPAAAIHYPDYCPIWREAKTFRWTYGRSGEWTSRTAGLVTVHYGNGSSMTGTLITNGYDAPGGLWDCVGYNNGSVTTLLMIGQYYLSSDEHLTSHPPRWPVGTVFDGMLRNPCPFYLISRDGQEVMKVEKRPVLFDLQSVNVLHGRYENALVWWAIDGNCPYVPMDFVGKDVDLGLVLPTASATGGGAVTSFRIRAPQIGAIALGGVDPQSGRLLYLAELTKRECKLHVEVDPPDGGSVTCSPAKAVYAPGELVTLTATPAAGTDYVFAGWSGDLSGPNNPATLVMDADKSVIANFRGGKPVACFQYTPIKPMAGGQILFDATCSVGDIVKYSWDFGDGTSGSAAKVCHVFDRPDTYTVRLTVTNSAGQVSPPEIQTLHLRLKNGDLLFWRAEGSWVPGHWTHVGIYDEARNQVIEARDDVEGVGEFVNPGAVWLFPFEDWCFPNSKCVQAMRVRSKDTALGDRAVAYALTELGMPFDWWSFVLGRKDMKDSNRWGWYCSELVWAAYLRASNNAINLDPDDFEVSPTEIAASPAVELLGLHEEECAATFWDSTVWGRVQCPADLEVIDPEGLVLSKYEKQVAGSAYEEILVDGEMTDLFLIPSARCGSYAIRVIPESEASPDATYSFEISVHGQKAMLAQDVLIRDIPKEPYTFLVSPNADLTQDGYVNYADLIVLAQLWLRGDCTATENWCSHCDFDWSGAIDFRDYAVIAHAWLSEERLTPHGLVAHWPLDDGSETVAVDSAGGSDGEVHGAAWCDGILGGALRFDGVDDYVDCGVHVGEVMSLSLWVYPESLSGIRALACESGYSLYDNNLRFEIRSGRVRYCFADGVGEQVYMCGATDPNNYEWSHLAVTRDGTEAAVYLNGVKGASAPYDFAPRAGSSSLTVGGSCPDAEAFKGRIDDVRLYERALSEEEIRDLAQAAP